MSSSSQYYHSYPETKSSISQPHSPSAGLQPPTDYETGSAPKSTSNTYQITQTGHSNWQLPPGWKVAHRETDGRMYFFELATGKTSWNHPSAQAPKTINGESVTSIPESPATASRRPDSHQCCAVFSCLVFPPLGIFALIHSIMTYRSWSKGKYGDSFDHSRQAHNFAWWAIVIFLGYVAYRFFFGDGWEGYNIFN